MKKRSTLKKAALKNRAAPEVVSAEQFEKRRHTPGEFPNGVTVAATGASVSSAVAVADATVPAEAFQKLRALLDAEKRRGKPNPEKMAAKKAAKKAEVLRLRKSMTVLEVAEKLDISPRDVSRRANSSP